MPDTTKETSTDIFINLKAARFDPFFESPDISAELEFTSESPFYLVQLHGPVQGSWLFDITDLGGTILGYIPDYTYIVYAEQDVKSDIADLPFVRWTGMYHPAYKIEPGLFSLQGQVQLNVMVFGTPDIYDNIAVVMDIIATFGGTTIDTEPDSSNIRVEVDASKITDIAFIPEVEWIDQYLPPVALMDNIRVFTGAESPLHEYGFNGTGIVGEVKDAGIDQDHVEFEGQLIGLDGNVDEDSHGTSTFGIVFAKGVDDQALGMLPGGKGVFCDWGVGRKQSIANMVNNWDGVFQSNSWSSGSADGSYQSNSRQNDESIFEYDVTMLYASGNGGNDGTVTQDATAKNVIAVGALNHYNNQDRTDDLHNGNQGNKGPTDDGRIKPDVVGPYDSIYTTTSGGGYTSGFGGTSGATPVAAGVTGLIYEMYRDNHFKNNPSGTLPHAATVKAIIIADAYQYEFSQGDRFAQGWGLVDVGNVYLVGENHLIDDESLSLETGESTSYQVQSTGIQPLKITLVWTDVPGTTSSSQHLVNDLHLKVTDPDGTVYWGNSGLEESKWSSSGGSADTVNNVENVFIELPMAGLWTIEVSAENIAQDGNTDTAEIDQSFALVASGVMQADHDIVISDLDLPRYYQVNNEAQVPAMVSNTGLEDEGGVLVRLLEDDVIVDTQTISYIQSGTSTQITLSWVPTMEKTSELTVEAVPVAGEDRVFNNQMSRSVDIFMPQGLILVDEGHGNSEDYEDFYEHLYSLKYPATRTAAINQNLLAQHNVLITARATTSYTPDELSYIDDFVNNGGGLFVIGDDDLSIYNDLTSQAGITWATPRGVGGNINDLNEHNVTEDVDELYMSSPNLVLDVELPAEEIAYDNEIVLTRVLVAVSQFNNGRIAALTDDNCLDDTNLDSSHNRIFGENVIKWLNINIPPIAIIDSPLNGGVYSSLESVLFNGSSSSDPDGHIIDHTWTSDIDGDLGTSVIFSMKLSLGDHEITLTVTDNGGRASQTALAISVIDPIPPTVTIQNPGDIVNKVVTLSGSASDGDGTVEAVEIRFDSSEWQLLMGTNQWEYEWDTTLFSDGDHTIEVRAQDNDGFYSDISSVTPTVDNTPPEILSGPSTTSVTDSSATIQWETDEPGDCIVEYWTGSEDVDLKTKSALVTEHNIILTDLSESTTYHYRIKTRDALGNEKDEDVERTFTTASSPDTTPPDVTISNINDFDVITGNVQVEVDAHDNKGIDRVEFYVNSQLKSTDSSSSYSWLWKTADGQYPDGFYSLKIVAYDLNDNHAEDEITVELDNDVSPPAIISKKANPNSIDNSASIDVLLTVEVSDPYGVLESVAIDLSSIGRSPYQNLYDDGTHGDEIAGDGAYSFEVTVPAGTDEGEKSLTVTLVYDGGKTMESSVELFVISGQNQEPLEDKGSDSSLDSNLIWLLLIAVFIIVGILGAVGLAASKKKRRQSFQAAEPVYYPQTEWK
jgi:hypothetical protein